MRESESARATTGATAKIRMKRKRNREEGCMIGLELPGASKLSMFQQAIGHVTSQSYSTRRRRHAKLARLLLPISPMRICFRSGTLPDGLLRGRERNRAGELTELELQRLFAGNLHVRHPRDFDRHNSTTLDRTAVFPYRGGPYNRARIWQCFLLCLKSCKLRSYFKKR